jgi:hypothetical protein
VAFLQGVGEKLSCANMVFLWWICGEWCPLAGPYKPAGCLANFLLGFRIYFWNGVTVIKRIKADKRSSKRRILFYPFLSL